MIGVLGISYKTAPIDIRAQFSFTKEEITQFAEQVQLQIGITEVVILSTCNRTEIYFYKRNGRSKDISLLIEQLHLFKKLSSRNFDSFYSFSKAKAIEHLFGVVSGIDSMVIGEDQIVNQVKEAYVSCTEAGLTDAVLMRLFQKSFECAKNVRTETDIQRGASSVSYLAVDAIAQLYPDLSDKRILLVGAGETGRLALYNLKKRGAQHFVIANRTYQKADDLAKEFNGYVVPFEHLNDYLHRNDIIVVATGAGKYIITQQDILKAKQTHTADEQLYVDLSVPRNIEPLKSQIEGIRMLEVDSLQEVIDTTKERREECVSYAKILIQKYVEDYQKWFDSRALRPIIQNINQSLRSIRSKELEEYEKSESVEVVEAVQRYTGMLTEKYIRYLISNLKELPITGDKSQMIDVIEQLFKADQKKK